MKVAVGSKNPVKIEGVKAAFEEFFDNIEIIPVKVESEVSDQPLNKEIKTGAENRARNAIAATNADFGVGIEGGILELHGVHYIGRYTAITDKYQRLHGSWSGFYESPKAVLIEIEKGKELGDIIDNLTGKYGTKQQEGAVGILTKGKITRTMLCRYSVIQALIPFLNKKFYER